MKTTFTIYCLDKISPQKHNVNVKLVNERKYEAVYTNLVGYIKNVWPVAIQDFDDMQ